MGSGLEQPSISAFWSTTALRAAVVDQNAARARPFDFGPPTIFTLEDEREKVRPSLLIHFWSERPLSGVAVTGRSAMNREGEAAMVAQKVLLFDPRTRPGTPIPELLLGDRVTYSGR